MTQEQKKYILNNYANIGCKQCAETLNIKISTVSSFASANSLKVSKEVIRKISSERSKKNWKNHVVNDEDYPVNPSYFTNCSTPESAYILGLLWADGIVYQKGYDSRVRIECLDEDMKSFKKCFNSSGNWRIYSRIGRISGKKMAILSTSNKKLVNFLLANDYGEKSNKSPDKILKSIPNELKIYFFRGWIDGDGCFYVNIKNNCRQFYISGSFKQDWNAFECFLKSLDIKYSICRNKNVKSKYSHLRITNRKSIFIFGATVYKNFENDKIGLQRKFDKLQYMI